METRLRNKLKQLKIKDKNKSRLYKSWNLLNNQKKNRLKAYFQKVRKVMTLKGLNEIKAIEKHVDIKFVIYETNIYVFNFNNLKR